MNLHFQSHFNLFRIRKSSKFRENTKYRQNVASLGFGICNFFISSVVWKGCRR